MLSKAIILNIMCITSYTYVIFKSMQYNMHKRYLFFKNLQESKANIKIIWAGFFFKK